VKIKLICLQNHLEQKGVGWSIEDSGTSRSCLLTSEDSDSRHGLGTVCSEHDSFVGGGITPCAGGASYVLDSTLTLVQNKTYDAGKCGLIWYQVIEE